MTLTFARCFHASTHARTSSLRAAMSSSTSSSSDCSGSGFSLAFACISATSLLEMRVLASFWKSFPASPAAILSLKSDLRSLSVFSRSSANRSFFARKLAAAQTPSTSRMISTSLNSTKAAAPAAATAKPPFTAVGFSWYSAASLSASLVMPVMSRFLIALRSMPLKGSFHGSSLSFQPRDPSQPPLTNSTVENPASTANFAAR
mmetsp:Transcript_3385/g.9723  ORF Transcript_3385/g.9723 Transcript_3385/m.9723 type:complete len:204 (+) Transcript_3385:509-1120(+)